MRMKEKCSVTRYTALAVSLVLAFCLTACGGLDNLLSDSDAGQIVQDTGEPFCRGVWAADNGAFRTGYYVFTNGGSGTRFSVDSGEGTAFTVETEEKRMARFTMDCAEAETADAEVRINEPFKRILTWEPDQRMEYLTLMSSVTPDNFRFYSAEAIVGAAEQTFGEMSGTYDLDASYQVNSDGTVEIFLFRQGESSRNVLAHYIIDSLTGQGKNETTAEGADFTPYLENAGA